VADNLTALDAALATIILAAKEIAGVKYPRSILTAPDGSDLTPLTDAELRATAVPVSGPVTDAQMRATALPVSGPLTDGQLRATAVPVSGPVTDAQMRATALPVSGPLTDGQLRATAVPVSAAALPLPSGASTEATLEAARVLLASLAAALSAHDEVAADGHPGVVMLAKRRDSDASAMVADGDFGYFSLDENQRLKVSSQPATYTDITGNITAVQATIGTPVAGGTVEGDVSRASNVMAFCTGTFSTVNCTFEGSLEASGDSNWFGIQAIRSNANTIETTTGNLSAQPAYSWEMSVNALARVRVRCTARTSGTQAWRFKLGTYATEPIPGAQVTATQPVSGTVTVTSTRITPNAADGHSTHSHYISAASTNDTLVLTGARAIGLITATNTNAAARYLKVYNKATAPTSGDTPMMTILLPPGQTVVVGGNSPIRAPLGLGFRLTTGIAVADTGAVSASEHTVSFAYT